MGFNAEALRKLVRDTLFKLDPFVPYNEDAVELLMLTAAVETQLGKNLKVDQEEDDFLTPDFLLNNYFGIFGMDVQSEESILSDYLPEHPELAEIVHAERELCECDTNYPYQIMLARIEYLRTTKRVPSNYNNGKRIREVARFWERYYKIPFSNDEKTYKEAQAYYNELRRSTDIF